MSRARNIKPGFCQNEDLAELPFETRLAFALLPMFADRAGRIEDRPKRIKMQMFPADNLDMERVLKELHEYGFIHRYRSGEGRYIQIVNFLKHQKPHPNEKASEIPEFSNQGDTQVQPRCEERTTKAEPNPASSLNPSSLNACKKPSSTATRFDAWWKEYPKKVEKKKARAIWKRRKLDEQAGTLIADVQTRMESDEKWLLGYIPNPTTYLNGDRWEDELQAAPVSLPKDRDELWQVRRRIGLEPFFDNIESCHAEIRARLREHPELRAAL